MPNWNEEQRQAISTRGKNILVAASAGSGKTAVLVERVRRLICEENVSVDSVLVVTFTNAAAAEMKDRIRESLLRELNGLRELNRTDDIEKIKYVKKQLLLLPQAQICTFHSFALDVIRSCFYLTDLEPSFSVCDETKAVLLKEEALDDILECEFNNLEDDSIDSNYEFVRFLDAYSGDRNFSTVREIILSTHKKLMAMPHPFQWLRDKIDILNSNGEDFLQSDLFRIFLDPIWSSLQEALPLKIKVREMLLDSGLDSLADKFNKELEYLKKAIEIIDGLLVTPKLTVEVYNRNIQDVVKALSERGVKLSSSSKDEEQIYKGIKLNISELRKAAKKITDKVRNFLRVPIDEKIQDMNETYSHALKLLDLILKFDSAYASVKKREKVVDFADIEHYCLKILEQEEPAALYRSKFKHVFIDEYQDTNSIQEAILKCVVREDNLFMVGDIKQSIYGFRMAEPSIFKSKYENFTKDNSGLNCVLDLNSNYRSSIEILNYINDVFENVMDGYDERAKLREGVSHNRLSSSELKTETDNNIMMYMLEKDDDSEDDMIKELKESELEAIYVAKLILESIGKPYFDKKSATVKRLEKRDIAVVMRKIRSKASIFYDVFKRFGIESYLDEEKSYFDTIEINVMLNLLSIIDNGKQDIPFISVLHSEIFAFDTIELSKIRSEHIEGEFTDAFEYYCESGSDVDLKQKCSSAKATIRLWREESLIKPLPSFIWELMIKSGYYIYVGRMPDGSKRQANLRILVERADSFVDGKQSSLYGFVKYLKALAKMSVQVPQAKLVEEDSDVVNIMTIHKSKGLEFPMVILMGINAPLKGKSDSGHVSLHRDIGVGLTKVDTVLGFSRKTIMQDLISIVQDREALEEEIRILYVALTRAKNFLYMVGSFKANSKRSGDDFISGNKTTYFEMLAPLLRWKRIKSKDMEEFIKSDFTYSAEDDEGESETAGDDVKSLEPLSKDYMSKLERVLTYSYPHESIGYIKSKYSVSEINSSDSLLSCDFDLRRDKSCMRSTDVTTDNHKGRVSDDGRVIKRFKDLYEAETASTSSALQRGSAYHKIIELIDFVRADAEGASYIEQVAKSAVSSGLIDDAILNTIDLDKIKLFLSSDLGARCIAASARGELYKEREFTLSLEQDGERILVQGIIDCYFREGGNIVLVDYKSGYSLKGNQTISIKEYEESLIEKYGEQINLYKKGLELSGTGSVTEAYLHMLDGGFAVNMESALNKF